jgi:hypothetical protein
MAANELDPHLRVPDDAHRGPGGTRDATVEAVGLVKEALKWCERLRGRLYGVHQMMGGADLGSPWVLDDVVGRNVIDGRWTFQIVEEFVHPAGAASKVSLVGAFYARRTRG